MNFLGRVLRFVFWVVVLSWSVALLRRLVAWMLRGGTSASAPAGAPGADVTGSSEVVGMGRKLVRDPVCGVHVAEVLSIPLRQGSETWHFCSVGCRDAYLRQVEQMNKLAANG